MYETIEEYFHTLPIFTNQNGKVISNTTCLVVAAPRCTLQIHMKLRINHQRFLTHFLQGALVEQNHLIATGRSCRTAELRHALAMSRNVHGLAMDSHG